MELLHIHCQRGITGDVNVFYVHLRLQPPVDYHRLFHQEMSGVNDIHFTFPKSKPASSMIHRMRLVLPVVAISAFESIIA
jgi:hypothetical protein